MNEFTKHIIDSLENDIKVLNERIEEKEEEKDIIEANFINKCRKSVINSVLVKAPLLTLFAAIVYTCNTEGFLNYGLAYLYSLGIAGAYSFFKIKSLKQNCDDNILKIDDMINHLDIDIKRKKLNLENIYDNNKKKELQDTSDYTNIEDKLYENAIVSDYDILNNFITQETEKIDKPKTLSRKK